MRGPVPAEARGRVAGRSLERGRGAVFRQAVHDPAAFPVQVRGLALLVAELLKAARVPVVDCLVAAQLVLAEQVEILAAVVQPLASSATFSIFRVREQAELAQAEQDVLAAQQPTSYSKVASRSSRLAAQAWPAALWPAELHRSFRRAAAIGRCRE